MVRLSAVIAVATVALACFAAADASSRHLLQSRESFLLHCLECSASLCWMKAHAGAATQVLCVLSCLEL